MKIEDAIDVLRLCAGGAFKAQKFQPATKLKLKNK